MEKKGVTILLHTLLYVAGFRNTYSSLVHSKHANVVDREQDCHTMLGTVTQLSSGGKALFLDHSLTCTVASVSPTSSLVTRASFSLIHDSSSSTFELNC